MHLSATLEGSGAGRRETGVGFLDHMLDLLARHARIDLDVQVKGDLQTGAHHTAEDTAIVLGRALDLALGERSGIGRYGSATVPMDEARASCAIDISGRPFTLFEADLPPGSTGGFEHELTEEFFRALANAFAPEHLQLIGADVEALASKVTAAGCLFVGASSGTAFGDYAAGSNHILPTAGAARFASGLSARHFRRRMAEVRIDAGAARKLAAAATPIALAEGFEWHARSLQARMGDN